MNNRQKMLGRIGLLVAGLFVAGLACQAPGVPEAPTLPPELQPTSLDEVTLPPPTTQPQPDEQQPPGAEADLVIPSGETVRVAVMAPQQGPVSNLGTVIEAGAVQAMEDYGAVSGFQVELLSVGSGCSPDGGRAAAEQIVAGPRMVGVIGPVCSNEASTALPIFENNNLVAVSPSTTVADINAHGPTVFNRVILHDGQPGSAGGSEADALPAVQGLYDELDVSLEEDTRFFSAYAYDAMTILLQSLQAVAQTDTDGALQIDRQTLKDQVRRTQNFEGLTGTISFDSSGNRMP